MSKSTNRVLLSGNEAVARGAYEAGCRVACAYPGTPSTQILEAIAAYKEIYAEWSVNEKVALEVVLGASMAGVRALYASKHVGLNVAADPLFSAAYIGARGGLVVVTCDDPGLHSSQNEQDNRYYGVSAKLPLLTPSDSQEAKDFTRLGFEISEEFDIPVLIRLTTRVCHSKGVVELSQPSAPPSKGYEKRIERNLTLPQFAKLRHYSLEERFSRLAEFADRFPGNRIEWGDLRLGFIADGVAYTYAREAFPEASFLKLGLSYPLPIQKVKEFCRKVKRVYVVEENDPFLETLIRALGCKVLGKNRLPRVDELNPGVVRSSVLGYRGRSPKKPESIPRRPPLLCPGCPHRGVFYNLRQLNSIITGDIGCYTLGALPPLDAMDTCVCMGGAITIAHGIEKAKGSDRKVVGVIGDSTFFHSGVTGLINLVYNQGDVLVVILDNLTTAMTGHQDHPGTGRTLMGHPTKAVDMEALARGCGVENVWVVDPYDLRLTHQVLKEAVSKPGPGVVIARRACALRARPTRESRRVAPELCTGCKLCLRLGCPAILLRDGKAWIDPSLCFPDCGMCAQVCNQDAID